MIYTAAHGVGDSFFAQIDRWLLLIPGALALAAIVMLLALSPGQPKPKNTGGNSGGYSQGAETPRNVSSTTSSDITSLQNGGRVMSNTSNNSATTSSSSTAPSVTTASSTGGSSATTSTGGIIGGKGGDGQSTTTPTTSDTGTTAPTDSTSSDGTGGSLTLPLTICVGSKDTSISLLGLTLDPICIN